MFTGGDSCQHSLMGRKLGRFEEISSFEPGQGVPSSEEDTGMVSIKEKSVILF